MWLSVEKGFRCCAIFAAVLTLGVVLSTAVTRAQASEPITRASPEQRPEPTRESTHALEDGQAHGPFTRGAVGLQFTGGAFVEAWNLNERRETLIDGSAGVWWTFLNRLTLLTEIHGTRVLQEPSRDAFVGGFTTVLRWHAAGSPRRLWFVELGPGFSWADTVVPPRGTRFNYIALIGTGISARVGRRTHATVGARWLHLSNNGREGRDHNPDIQSLGGYAGLLITF